MPEKFVYKNSWKTIILNLNLIDRKKNIQVFTLLKQFLCVLFFLRWCKLYLESHNSQKSEIIIIAGDTD